MTRSMEQKQKQLLELEVKAKEVTAKSRSLIN
jgi:hypothetical protein